MRGAKPSLKAQQQQNQHGAGDPNSVLRIVCGEALETHPTLAKEAARLILAMFREVAEIGIPATLSLAQLPEKLNYVFSDDIFLSYSCQSALIPFFRQLDRGALQHMLMESSLVAELLEHASEQEPDPSIRLQCTTLLIDLYYDETTVLTNIPDLDVRDSFHEVLRSALVHPDKVYKVTIFGASFALLDHLLQVKSAESPILMKTLIAAFIELIRDKTRERIAEEFVLRSYLDLFEKHPELPLNLVVEPVAQVFAERLKGERIQAKHRTGHLTSEEIWFLIKIAQHEKLQPQTAFHLLELFSTVYIGKPQLSLSLLPSILALIMKFQSFTKVLVFTETILLTKALSSIISLKKDELTRTPNQTQPMLALTASPSVQPPRFQRLPQKLSLNKTQQADVTLKLQRYGMVNLVQKLYELGVASVEQQTKDQIRPLQERYRQMYGKESSAYEYLVAMLKLAPEAGEDNTTMALVLVQEGQESPDKNLGDPLERKVRDFEKQRLQQKNKERLIQLSKIKDPKNEIALRAIEEINGIKHQRLKKQQADRIEEVQKKERQDHLTNQTSQNLQMSKLMLNKEANQRRQQVKEILGREGGGKDQEPGEVAHTLNPFHEYILNSPVLQTQLRTLLNKEEVSVLLQFSRVPREGGIMLVNFELEEEDRERDAMRLLVFRNQNLFAHLFIKYSQVSSQVVSSLNKRGRLNDIPASGERTITMIEIQKFMKDHGVDSHQMSVKDITVMVKMINELFLLRLGASAMEYAGFVQLVLQSAIYTHRKGRVQGCSLKEATLMMSSQMVLGTLKQYREYAQKRGEHLDVLQDSEKKNSKGKSEQIVQSNGQIQNQIFLHQIPESVKSALGDAKVIVLEILNEIMLKQFQTSIFTSYVVDKVAIKGRGAAATDQKKKKTNNYDSDYGENDGQLQRKRQPNYSIYAPQLLAKQIQLRNPTNEKRNIRRDKENETILMALPMSPAVKLACYELQQVKPQSQLEDMREVSLLMELVLQSVTGQKTYEGTYVENPKVVRKQKVIRQRFLEVKQTPKVQKVAEIEKAKQYEYDNDRAKKNAEFLRRGLQLKEQLKNGTGNEDPNQYGLQELDMKELLQLRAQNVGQVVLQSRQRYADRLMPPGRNGEDRKMTETQSQKVLKKSNSNHDILKPPRSTQQTAKKIRGSHSTIQVHDSGRGSGLTRLPSQKPLDDKKIGLMQFYLMKEVQDIYAEFAQPLGRLFKEYSEFVQKIEKKQLVESVRLMKPGFESIIIGKGLDAGNLFDEMCNERDVINTERSLTFEEFKKSLIKLNLLYLPAEQPTTPSMNAPRQSYKQVLQSKLLQSERGFRQFLTIFVKKPIKEIVSDGPQQVEQNIGPPQVEQNTNVPEPAVEEIVPSFAAQQSVDEEQNQEATREQQDDFEHRLLERNFRTEPAAIQDTYADPLDNSADAFDEYRIVETPGRAEIHITPQ